THEKLNANNSSERIPQNRHGVTPPEKDNSPKEIADAPNNRNPANNKKENAVKDNPKKEDAPKAVADNTPVKNTPPQIPAKEKEIASDKSSIGNEQKPFKNKPETSGGIPIALRLDAGPSQSMVNASGHSNA